MEMGRIFQKWDDITQGRLIAPVPDDLKPEAEDISFNKLFRSNSIQPLLELVVFLIRSDCGGCETSGELLLRIQEKLMDGEELGEIVSSFDRGTKFCCPDVFQKEEQILRIFRDGLGQGRSIALQDGHPSLGVLRKALAAPNQFRIIEMTGKRAREVLTLLGNYCPIHCSIVLGFSAEAILEAIGSSSGSDQLILAIKPPKPVGRSSLSSFRSELLQLVFGGKRPARLQRGRVSISVLRFGTRPEQEILRALVRSDSGPGVITGVGTSEELATVFKNFATLAASVNPRMAPIDVIQPWATRNERAMLPGACLIGLHQSPVVRHGTFFKVVQVEDLLVCLQSPSGRRKSIPWLALEGVRDKVEFVREEVVVWPFGISARVLRSFSSGRNRVKAGQWHSLDWVSDDGTLALNSGNGLGPGFRLLEPMSITTEPEIRGLERLLVWHESGSASDILRHRPTRKLIVFTEFPLALKREIRLELLRQRQRDILKKLPEKRRMKPAGRDYWRGVIGYFMKTSPKRTTITNENRKLPPKSDNMIPPGDDDGPT